MILALFNIVFGDINAGEWGLFVFFGREYEVYVDIDLVLEYVLAFNCE